MKALAAYRQQKNCEAEDLFVVEGVKMAKEAIRSGWKIRTVCATAEAVEALGLIDGNVADEVFEVRQEQLERLSSLRAPQGVWMVVERGDCKSPGTEDGDYKSPGTLALALDGIQDPGNMGTILRTCDWFGVRRVLCSQNTVSCWNPKVVQATMGAIFRTRVEYCDLAERLSSLAEEGYTVYGAMLDGENVFERRTENGERKTENGERRTVLVIGNEGHGISPEVAAVVGRKITIPNIGGTCESLNASVATGIIISCFVSGRNELI